MLFIYKIKFRISTTVLAFKTGLIAVGRFYYPVIKQIRHQTAKPVENTLYNSTFKKTGLFKHQILRIVELITHNIVEITPQLS